MALSDFNTQTAYQRWELASLEREPANQFRTVPPEISQLAQEMMAAKDQGFQQGYDEGYQAGVHQGKAEGEAQALAEGRSQQQLIATRLTGLFDRYQQDVQQAREQIAEQLLQLSFDMAQAIVRTSLTLQPELILPLIEQALADLPNLELPASIHLHPDDAELVETAMGPRLHSEGWRLIRDPAIARGGCTINTASRSLNLELPSRWQQLMQQLELAPPVTDA